MKSRFTIFVLIGVLAASGLSCHLLPGKKMFNRLGAEQTGINFENTLSYSDSLSVLLLNRTGGLILRAGKSGRKSLAASGMINSMSFHSRNRK